LNILGIGPGELLLILMLALIVFGPRRLPEVGKTLGKTLREMRNMSDELTAQFRSELESATQEMNSLAEDLTTASHDAAGAVRSAANEAEGIGQQVSPDTQNVAEDPQQGSRIKAFSPLASDVSMPTPSQPTEARLTLPDRSGSTNREQEG